MFRTLRTRGRRGLSLPALALALLPLACQTPGSGPPLPADPGPGRSGEVPEWVGQPLSWNKLQSIEAWLASPDSRRDAFWRVQGELQLAEGRMALQNTELGRPGTGDRAQRESAALAGFQRVVTDPGATTRQRELAEAGVARITGARAVPASATLLPQVQARRTWHARTANPAKLSPADRPWRWITIHHSALEGAPPLDGTLAASQRAVRGLQNAHMNGRGYGDVGYHFLIDNRGRVFEGRELRWQGAHVRGDGGQDHNPGNLGVCLIGNFDNERPSPEMIAALEKLVRDLQRKLSIPPANVRGHRDWKATDCPGRNLMPYVQRLKG